MDIVLLRPGFLLLLLVLPAVWFVPRRAPDVLIALLRSLALAALVLALARPAAFVRDPTEHHVFVVDRSASVDPAQRDLATRALERVLAGAGSDVAAKVVVLGADEPALHGSAADNAEVCARLPEGSSLSTALEAAGRAIPDGSRGAVTLIGDGRSTDRRWGPAVLALCARSIPVHTVALEPLAGDVVPVGLGAIAPLRVGQTARIAFDVVGRDAVVDARLVGPDGNTLATVEGLAVDGRATAVLEFEPRAPGFLQVALEIDVVRGVDARPDDNTLATTLAVQDPLRVLYLGNRQVGGGDRLGELLGRGFLIDAREPNGSGDGGEPLDGYDLVWLDDRPATALPEGIAAAVADAVRERGLGLVLSGGRAAFGPGGYHRTPIGDLLPVDATQKEEKRDPSTTLVIIIDTSGSMSGMRVTLAKEVARLAMRRLLPHDKVGIVEFYGAKRWAAPIQPASNLIELQRALNRLDAGGGTVILPAIEEAFYGLQNVDTRYKHVVILTDGGVETGAFEPLLRKMADKGINVSAVLVGPEAHSEFLVTLANWGKGRFYSVPNRFNLPELILKQPASAKLPAYRPGPHALRARGGRGWWGDVDHRTVPPLGGYVETRARPGALSLLETAEAGHPVLASWRYGLGRVTALTTEPTGQGTASWRAWDGFGAFLGRVAARTALDDRAPFRFALRRDDEQLVLTAVRREHLAAAAEPQARVLGIDGRPDQELAFRARADGVYTATLERDPASEVRVVAGSVDAAPGTGTRLASSPSADVAGELQVDPLRALDLGRLAAATGGRALSAVEVTARDLAAGGGERPIALEALWPWCILLALGTYLAELTWRRLPALSRASLPT